MNARHIIAAAVLACFGLGAASIGVSGLCTQALAAPPLNLKAEAAKAPAKKAFRKAAGKTAKHTRKSHARKAHRNTRAAETPAPETTATQPQEQNEQIPVVAVKTTREMSESIAIVNASEMSELDRAAAPDISLAAYSIMSYLGGPAAIAPDEDAAPAPADSAELSTEVRNSYASTAPPAAPENHIALEYVLMTFACALAAAAAIRVFVV